jgi:multidrug efflux pump subunit AcrB
VDCQSSAFTPLHLHCPSVLILLVSPIAILRTPTDIFPNINIPVISVIWQYSGLNPEEFEGRITSVYERVLTTLVNDVQHIESTTLNGTAVVRIFLQPNADLTTAIAQVTAVSQTSLRQMPPGITPPLVLTYNASTVPILQLALSGKTLTEQDLNDFGQNFIRPQLVTVSGASIPWPWFEWGPDGAEKPRPVCVHATRCGNADCP